MRRIRLAILLSAAMSCGALAATPQHHVLAEFHLAPDVCLRAAPSENGAALQLQILALNLKGTVYYQDTVGLKLVSPASMDGCVFKHLLLLEKGDYLLQFLFFDREQDRFELVTRSFTAKGAGDTILTLPVDALSGRNFSQHRRDLIFQDSHPEKAFRDHMLWFRIRYLSRRNPEQWPDVFSRLKVLAGSANLALIERSRLGRSFPDEAYYDRLFEIAVRADNVRYQAGRWNSGQAGGADAEKDLLKSLNKEAKGIQSAGHSLSVPRRKTDREVREEFIRTFRGQSLPQQRETMNDLAAQLQSSVESYFFTPHTTSVEDSLASRDPMELAARVRTAADLAKESIDDSRGR